MAFRIGMLLFPGMTQLDLTGPYEVFIHFPDTVVLLVAKTPHPVPADGGIRILPTTTVADCPPLDLVCVPGGAGVNALIEDAEILAFLRAQAATAGYVTSVCTGSLVLGAAGLLQGRRAACHWMSRPMLAAFGALPAAERVVFDGPIVTGGGVTAGIDFALSLGAVLFGEATARQIQLELEYAPAPPFDAGTPEGAGTALVEQARKAAELRQTVRQAAIDRAAQRLTDGQATRRDW